MPNRTPAQFYYTRKLPVRAVSIAEVATSSTRPADLTDVHNAIHAAGDLTITPFPTGAVVTAPAIGETVSISGQTTYLVNNQFFEITNQADDDSNPLYYGHLLPLNVSQVSVLNQEGEVQTGYVVREVTQDGEDKNYLLHSFDGEPFWVRYIDSLGFLRKELLQYTPVIQNKPFSTSDTGYQLVGRTLFLETNGTYRMRFTAVNGYQVLDPYNALPNEPWFVRVRFNLTPWAPEYGRQIFLPRRPYTLATWVPGKVLGSNLIEFDRKPILSAENRFPDILVYDKNFVIKYALAGATRRGHLFPWKLNQISGFDSYRGRVETLVNLEPDDIVFGFYSYSEPDVVYRSLDVNPFTNTDVRNRIIQFFHKSNGQDPYRYIYHRILNSDGSVFATSDPAPGTGTMVVFGTVLVGTSIGLSTFTLTDRRVRGGGLAEPHQSIPESIHFWDLGYLDGKPLPIGGALIVYLPAAVLDKFSRAEIQERVEAILPVGVLPAIRYYDSDGEETV